MLRGKLFKVTNMNKGFREKPQVSMGTVVGSLAAHFSAGEGVITTDVSQNSSEGAKREPADHPPPPPTPKGPGHCCLTAEAQLQIAFGSF